MPARAGIPLFKTPFEKEKFHLLTWPPDTLKHVSPCFTVSGVVEVLRIVFLKSVSWFVHFATRNIRITPRFAHMSIRLSSMRTSDSQMLWMICFSTHLGTFKLSINITGFGFTPSCDICRNNANGFCPCSPYPKNHGIQSNPIRWWN